MHRRAEKPILQSPVTIYEMHAGSWLRGEGNRFLTYRELADRLVPYVAEMNYTHIELLPILEHPFSGSWGYQVTGFFAPTSRFGTPDDFRYFVDRCHQAGIGVILDWVPGHFPRDQHGLHFFDGTFLFEHADPRQGEHKEWGTLIFNYGRTEVQSFLLSSAQYWIEEFHLDGFRVDAVASMLYLDYNRKEGEWLPNVHGGRENLEAISFLRRFNELCHRTPGVFTVAEESTSFPGVSHPTYLGGLGFTMKWNMGWMHDMFNYFKQDPIFRKGVQQNITFSLMYAFSENFVLPISHDEVVHGKASLIGKMPGDEWQRFANCRCFLAYMYGHPGKKLLFMGQELGQYEEWSEERSLNWPLLQFEPHRKLRETVRELNRLVRDEPALHEVDFHWKGFEWIDFKDVEASVISFLRRGKDPGELILFVCNFTPVVREDYRLGVPEAGTYDKVLNTDAEWLGGSGVEPPAVLDSSAVKMHDRMQSVLLRLPPLAVVAYKWRKPPRAPEAPKEKEAPLPISDEELEKLMMFEDDPELAYALT
jgi:1,4-alpha-glucan branching enzyme